jgi:hypothetical protein
MDKSDRKVLRLELPREQIQAFLDDLNNMQLEYVDQAVEQKAKQGYPEASAVIKSIMEKK